MPVRKAKAVWKGTIGGGNGFLKTETGSFEGEYSAQSRFEEGAGTNPEELIAAAHSGCFSMALSAALTKAGLKPEKIETSANVHIDKVGEGWKITKVELFCEAKVPGIEAETFNEHAQAAKTGCPVSQALAGTDIELTAKLV